VKIDWETVLISVLVSMLVVTIIDLGLHSNKR